MTLSILLLVIMINAIMMSITFIILMLIVDKLNFVMLSVGAMTLSMTAVSIMTLNIKGLYGTLSINDIQHTQQ